MHKLLVDIETRSRLDVKRYGAYRHVECPDFRILMMAWSVNGDPVQTTTDQQEIQSRIGTWSRSDGMIVAHNASFERICFSRLLGLPTGEYLDPARFRDTMALAGEHGLPQSLKECAKALGAPAKDEAGTRLINLFSKPNRQGGWNDSLTHPTEWNAFIDYCKGDVEALIAIDRQLEWPTEHERQVWIAAERINDRGMLADVPMALTAQKAAVENTIASKARITELTCVDNPASQPQMMAWAKRVDLPLPNLRAETIADLLAHGGLDDLEREVLTLRTEVAQAATKKYAAVVDNASSFDSRVRGGFRFFGAHTGRWSGRGVQLQNLPRASLASDAHVEAALLDLELGLGGSASTLKALVRSTFVGPLTVVDYAAIEARVLAWLAGERWAIQAFRDGRDIYLETAARMGERYTRQQGKTATLALGYASGVNGLRAMGAEGDDDELQSQVDAWRRANRRIVRLWDDMGQAFGDGGAVGLFLRVERDGHDRHLRLPSGRAITYRNVRWDKYRIVDAVTGETKAKEGWRFSDPRKNGARGGTYGGRLVENATQAVARDLLAEALVRLEERGFPVVGHIHDEILVDGAYDVDDVSKVMCESPKWAVGLPVDGEGAVVSRYRK